YRGACPFRRRPRRSIAASQPYRPGELLRQRLDLRARLLLPPEVVAALGLRQLGVQGAEPLPVGGLRPGVGHAERPVAGSISLAGSGASRALPDQVEDVELLARTPQQVGEVVEALQVLHAGDDIAVGDGPVVALATER